MASATMTTKGQLTVPKKVREELGLRPGVQVEILVNPDRSATLLPITRKVSEVFGMLSRYRKKRPVSVEEMDAGIAQAMRKGRIRI